MGLVEVLLDSNVIIDHLRGVSAATETLLEYPQNAISVVSWIEILAGVQEADRSGLRYVLSGFSVLPLSQDVAERTVQIRYGSRLKLPDAMILATAQSAGRVLLTRNTRDFPAGTPGVHTPYIL